MIKYLKKNRLVLAALIVTATAFITIWLIGYNYKDEVVTAVNSASPNDEVPVAKVNAYIPQSEKSLIAAIKNEYPVDAYHRQLLKRDVTLKEELEKVDLVERVVLEREILLNQLKIDSFTKSYTEKLYVLVDTIRFLETHRADFKDKEIDLALGALMKGDTQAGEILLRRIHDKYRVTLGGASIDSAAKAVYLLGRIAEERLRYQKAYQHYRQAVKYDPENTDYLLIAGKTADNLALYRKAVIYYEAALHNMKKNANISSKQLKQLLITLGKVWESRAEPKKAQLYYQQAAKITPVDDKP